MGCISVSAEETPQIYERSKAAVYNPQTGTFIFDQDGERTTESATSTKMTALILIYDHFYNRTDTTVTVKAEHLKSIGAATNPATPMIGLKSGNTYTVEELIKTACVSWANDAINPLIYAVCQEKDIEYADFIELMNQYVSSIGCVDTVYKNALGIADEGNRTTAKDVAVICAEFYNRYDLLDASGKAYYHLQGSTIHTRNYLLSERIMAGNYLKGARGFFAGQARSNGGYCVATSVENGPLTYIVVVLDGGMFLYDEEGNRYFEEGKNPYTDVKTLVSWAKSNYTHKTVCRAGDAIDELMLELGKDKDHVIVCAEKTIETISLTGDDLSGLVINITYDPERVYTFKKDDGTEVNAVKAPVSKGETIGMAEFILNGISIGTTNLNVSESIDADTVINFLNSVEDALFSPIAKTIFTVVMVLLGLYLAYCLVAFTVRVVRKVKKDAADTQKEQKLKAIRERKDKKK